MNEEAEKMAEELYWRGKVEKGFNERDAIIAAMRWAYADCARISRSASDEIGEYIAQIIEDRAK